MKTIWRRGGVERIKFSILFNFAFLIIQFAMPFWDLICCNDQSNDKKSTYKRKSKKQSIYQQEKSPLTPKKKFKKPFQELDLHKPQKKDIYDGEQLNSVPHGTGIKHFVNGDYYRGEWVNGLKEGRGIHSYFQIRGKYEGEWKQNLKNGHGKYTEENGSYYDGEFKDGVKHGKGSYFDNEKQILFLEEYDNGVLIERKEMKREIKKQAEQFPTLVLDKERFNTQDLRIFEDNNPQIKQFDLDFLLKYYGLCKTINLDFIDQNISEWTIKQVLTFLQEIDLKDYQEVFYENKIKGKDLISLQEIEMKIDLKMKLGDRKRLMNYIQYISSLHKQKKNLPKKSSKTFRNRGSFRTQTSMMRKVIESVGNVIMQKSDEEWQESQSTLPIDYQKEKKEKTRNFVTEDWEKFHSNVYELYRSEEKVRDNPNSQQKSNITEKGSEDQEIDEFEPLYNKRKKSEEKKEIINSLVKKEKSSDKKSSSSSQSSLQNDLKTLKKKKTTANGHSTEMEDLYRFLKDHQNLDFLIKQKDIEIIDQIGEGGYGKVYRGKYISCPIAVKDYMKAGRLDKSREDFMKQVQILSDLKHPNIVLYMGLCIKFNHYQLVTEFMDNGSLYDQIHQKKTKFTNSQRLQIIDDIVRGMVYLHSMKNLLHRDLKSSNVLIAQDWKVKLCDFGLSGHKKKQSKKNNRIGTYQWMAPEVIRNEQIDFASDVYSFGVIIWELLSEQVPYEGLLEAQIIGLVGYDKEHVLYKTEGAIPEDADQFIISLMQKCLEKNPQDRPSFIQIQQQIDRERERKSIVKQALAPNSE